MNFCSNPIFYCVSINDLYFTSLFIWLINETNITLPTCSAGMYSSCILDWVRYGFYLYKILRVGIQKYRLYTVLIDGEKKIVLAYTFMQWENGMMCCDEEIISLSQEENSIEKKFIFCSIAQAEYIQTINVHMQTLYVHTNHWAIIMFHWLLLWINCFLWSKQHSFVVWSMNKL